MTVKLETYTPKPERAIAKAARISRLSKGEGLKDDRQLIRELIEKGHYSVLEFADATFYLNQVSRSFLAQITRHRLASFMVESMRYTEPNGDKIPKSIATELDDDLFDQYIKAQEFSNNIYDRLVDAGIKKEDARFVLPIGTMTSMYMRANFREWRHIIKLRTSSEAQWEIREVVEEMGDKLYNIAPSVFKDLVKCD